MQYINIKSGSYRNAPIEDMSFPLVQPYKMGAKGGYVTVDANGVLPGRGIIRILVDRGDFELTGEPTAEPIAKAQITETDEQVMERIGDRFAILDEMTAATVNGDVRAMIVARALASRRNSRRAVCWTISLDAAASMKWSRAR